MTLNRTGLITINDMYSEGFIPKEGNFDITERLIYEYMSLYNLNCRLNLQTNAKHSKMHTRKMGGLTLLNEKKRRELKSVDCKEGFIYFLSNPSWPKHTKIGMTFDVIKRVNSYQTYSPFRDYKLLSYEFVTNRRNWESWLLQKFQVNPSRGNGFLILKLYT